jgi:DNA-binding SARP family transcriptional activator
MSVLSVRLLGEFSVTARDQPLQGLEGRKVHELFAYLLVGRNRRHSRESVAEMLWADSLNGQARKNLRQTLWQVQAALNAEPALAEVGLLTVEPDWICLHSCPELWSDIEVLEHAQELSAGVAGQQLPEELCAELRTAIALYRGDFLDDCYEEWCLLHRHRLQQIYLALLDKLMVHAEVYHEHDFGIAYGARVLAVDRASERTHLRLMRLNYLAGDRTAALRQYEQCVAALSEELDVRPTKATTALFERIRVDAGIDAFVDSTRNDEHTSAVTADLSRLESLLFALSELEAQTKRCLLEIRHTLHS